MTPLSLAFCEGTLRTSRCKPFKRKKFCTTTDYQFVNLRAFRSTLYYVVFFWQNRFWWYIMLLRFIPLLPKLEVLLSHMMLSKYLLALSVSLLFSLNNLAA